PDEEEDGQEEQHTETHDGPAQHERPAPQRPGRKDETQGASPHGLPYGDGHGACPSGAIHVRVHRHSNCPVAFSHGRENQPSRTPCKPTDPGVPLCWTGNMSLLTDIQLPAVQLAAVSASYPGPAGRVPVLREVSLG